MASIGISDVVTDSVYSEKTRMKKLMMKMIIIIFTQMKNHLLVNEKGDVGWLIASRKSMKTRD